MSLPYIDRIWRVRSSLEIDGNLSSREVFARLDPLFQTQGTTCTAAGDTLTYSKKNPAAQDKLATFTAGTLRHVRQGGSARLEYDVTSTALLLCFLAPLFFLAFAGLILVVNEIEAPYIAAEKVAEEKEKEKEKEKATSLHWIDEMLGAPQPKQPGEDQEKTRAEEEQEKEDEDEANHSPDRSLQLAALFLVIYCVGRVLEPYLLKRTFRSALAGDKAAREAGAGIGT